MGLGDIELAHLFCLNIIVHSENPIIDSKWITHIVPLGFHWFTICKSTLLKSRHSFIVLHLCPGWIIIHPRPILASLGMPFFDPGSQKELHEPKAWLILVLFLHQHRSAPLSAGTCTFFYSPGPPPRCVCDFCFCFFCTFSP